MSIGHWDKLEAFVQVGDIEEFVLGFVELYDYVTFAELAAALGRAVEGTVRVSAPHDANLVLWDGVSETFAKAVEKLLHTKRVCLEPVPELAYVLHSKTPALPVAERHVNHEYEEPHWLPAVLRPGQGARGGDS